MKASRIVMSVLTAVLLFGCSDGTPSCKEMVKSIDTNMAGTGVRNYFYEERCKEDEYSALLRKCLSVACSSNAMKKCVSASHIGCLKSAKDQGAIDRCTALKEDLIDMVETGAMHEHDRRDDLFAGTRPKTHCDQVTERRASR